MQTCDQRRFYDRRLPVWRTICITTLVATCVGKSHLGDVVGVESYDRLVSHEVLVANTEITNLTPFYRTELQNAVSSLGATYFSRESDLNAWAAIVSLNTSIHQETWVLKNQFSTTKMASLFCGAATGEKAHARLVPSKSVKNPSYKTDLSTVAGAKKSPPVKVDLYKKSFTNYLSNLELSACRYGLMASLSSLATLDNVSTLALWSSSGWLKAMANLKIKKTVFNTAASDDTKVLLFADAAKAFKDGYASEIIGSLQRPQVYPTLFYHRASLHNFIREAFGVSDVKASAAELAATHAARAFSLTEAEAREWIGSVALSNQLELPIYGLAQLSKKWGPGEASMCGLPETTSLELNQSWTGFIVSACMWKNLTRPDARDVSKIVAFYKSLPIDTVAFVALPVAPKAAEKAIYLDTSPILKESGEVGEEAFLPPRSAGASLDAKLILTLMDIVKAPLSLDKRSEVADKIAAVGSRMIDSPTERRDWYIVLAIESLFIDGLTSATGAYGYGQLIPSYYMDFGKSCDFFDTAVQDIQDDISNLMLSACYIQFVRGKQESHSISMALVAYNAGPYSKDVKTFGDLGSIGLEPANYVARFTIILERLEKEPSVTKVTDI